MWGGYCPGSSRPHTPPTGIRKRQRSISAPFLYIYPHLSIVLVSTKSSWVLQAREIRRIDFSAVYRHNYSFSCGNGKCRPHKQQKQARRTSLLRFVSFRCLAFVCTEHRFINVFLRIKFYTFPSRHSDLVISAQETYVIYDIKSF